MKKFLYIDEVQRTHHLMCISNTLMYVLIIIFNISLLKIKQLDQLICIFTLILIIFSYFSYNYIIKIYYNYFPFIYICISTLLFRILICCLLHHEKSHNKINSFIYSSIIHLVKRSGRKAISD